MAAQRARALGVGLLSGGYGRDELERAGACRVYEDPADLLRHIDRWAAASEAQMPTPVSMQMVIPPSRSRAISRTLDNFPLLTVFNEHHAFSCILFRAPNGCL